MASSKQQFDSDLKETKKSEALGGVTSITGGVTNIILRYYGPDDYSNNYYVSSHGEAPLVSTLFNTIKTQRLEILKTLLTAIVSGEPNKAIAILKKYPSLLLEKLEEGVVVAPSGHQFNLKPYQAAIAVGDYELAKQFETFFENKEEIVRQFEEQCPEGWEAQEEKIWQPIYEQRDKLALTIRDNKGDITSSGDPDYIISVREGSPVKQELHKFWRLLDAKLNEVITAGKRPLNLILLLTTLQIFDEHYADYFGGKRNDPRALLWVQDVIGCNGIQRFLSTNDVQAYEDGLLTTTDKLRENQSQERSTSFKIYHSAGLPPTQPTDFYPLQPRGSDGRNFALFGVRKERSGFWMVRWGGVGTLDCGACWNGIYRLMEIKNKKLTELYAPSQKKDEPKSSSCLVM